jgi:hypothetical protein
MLECFVSAILSSLVKDLRVGQEFTKEHRTRVDSGLTQEQYTKQLGRDKRSNLFGLFVRDGEKNFCIIDILTLIYHCSQILVE